MLILVMLVMKVVMVVVMMVMVVQVVVDGSDVVDSGEWDDGGDERRKGGRGQGGRSSHQAPACTLYNTIQYTSMCNTIQ